MSVEKDPHIQDAVQFQELQHEAEFKNPGVKRIAAISSQLGFVARVFLFFGIFLIAYVYGLDGQLRVTYQVLTCHDTFIPLDNELMSTAFGHQ